MSTSNANPSSGTARQPNPTKTAYTGAATISNITLMLAQENNLERKNEVINMCRSPGGMKLMIPYTQAFKISNSGSTQTITLQLNNGFGHTLMKIYHAPFHNSEVLDVAYDNSNNGTLVDGSANLENNQKTLQYYTQLNNNREQDLTLDTTGTVGIFTDYMYQKEQLKGSIIDNLNVFQYNWVHVSDYSKYGPTRIQEGDTDNLISGIPLTPQSITWAFYGVKMNTATTDIITGNASGGAYQHYNFCVFSRQMVLDGNGAMLM
jgi:hypothetical protein